ncbi:SDR family NAD(P)-dependent oxidoreductase [Streptomyces sp. MMBL 11-3]|uniref:SDR family NAD(P)-dependent oxidoreductase n=1 Tax=Streptomyces sp. MMBL 11-3 TaxID=3382639 RepID=UPI0039B3F3C1
MPVTGDTSGAGLIQQLQDTEKELTDDGPVGKAAAVTGASRGIGWAVAVRLGRLGASVVVNYSRDASGAAVTVTEIEALLDMAHSRFDGNGPPRTPIAVDILITSHPVSTDRVWIRFTTELRFTRIRPRTGG